MVNGVINTRIYRTVDQVIISKNEQNTRNAGICLFKLKLRIYPCLAFHYAGSEIIGNS